MDHKDTKIYPPPVSLAGSDGMSTSVSHRLQQFASSLSRVVNKAVNGVTHLRVYPGSGFDIYPLLTRTLVI